MKIEITNQVKDDFLASLKTLISYPSVLNEGENGTTVWTSYPRCP